MNIYRYASPKNYKLSMSREMLNYNNAASRLLSSEIIREQ